MKVVHSKRVHKQLKQITELMNLRIDQLKKIDPEHWWELTLNDEMYKFLCQRYSELKIIDQPKYEMNEEEMKNLLLGFIK